MTAPISCLTDGDFDTELQLEATGTERPFGNDPAADVYAQVHDRMMEIALASFAPRVAARTNYTNNILYSEDFTNAAWTKTACSMGVGAYTNPINGGSGGQLLSEGSATSFHGISQPSAYLFTALSYSYSVFLKNQNRSWAWVQVIDSGGISFSAYFNLAAGTIGQRVGLSSATIIPVADGWSRCTITFTPLHDGLCAASLGVSTGDGVYSYAGSIAFPAAYVYGAHLDVLQSAFPYIPTTSAARTIGLPDLDPDDPFAFLVAESKPTVVDGELFRFNRTFARIPADQVKPSSILFPRPVLHGIKNGTAYAVAFDEDQLRSWLFTSRKSVSSIAAIADGTATETSTAPLLPAGITIVCRGTSGTSSFNTSDTVATIQTALQAAWANANVPVTKDAYKITAQMIYSGTGGGVIVEVSTTSSAIVIEGNPSDFTIAANTTTAATSTPADPSARSVHAVSHGGVVGDRVALWRGDALVSIGTVIAVAGADDFTLELDAIPGKDEVITHCAFSSDAALCVVNGPKPCDVRQTTRYYLPGYTLGIDTDADIPKQTPQIDPITWLGCIIANTAWPVYQLGDLGQYMGAILQQETTTLQLSDVVDTVTP